jgi:hypothetical protein
LHAHETLGEEVAKEIALAQGLYSSTEPVNPAPLQAAVQAVTTSQLPPERQTPLGAASVLSLHSQMACGQVGSAHEVAASPPELPLEPLEPLEPLDPLEPLGSAEASGGSKPAPVFVTEQAATERRAATASAAKRGVRDA